MQETFKNTMKMVLLFPNEILNFGSLCTNWAKLSSLVLREREETKTRYFAPQSILSWFWHMTCLMRIRGVILFVIMYIIIDCTYVHTWYIHMCMYYWFSTYPAYMYWFSLWWNTCHNGANALLKSILNFYFHYPYMFMIYFQILYQI